MSDLEANQIIKAPGIVMFFTFINSLIYEKRAKFSDISNKAILLDSEASNCFVLGRDDRFKPYIGVQDVMIPWFFEMPWDKVAICPKEKYIYLIAQEKDEIHFVLGLKPKAKRMILLFDPKNEKLEESSVNMKVIKLIKNDIAVSYNNGMEGLKVSVINSLSDIIEVQEDKESLPEEENNDGFVILRRK